MAIIMAIIRLNCPKSNLETATVTIVRKNSTAPTVRYILTGKI